STHGTGRFERAIEASLEGIAADSDFAIPYVNLALAYFFTDRFTEAERTLQRASARKLEMPLFLVLGYNIAVLKGDQEQMDRAVGLGRGKAWRNTGWPTRRLSLWLVPAGYRPRGGHRTERCK